MGPLALCAVALLLGAAPSPDPGFPSPDTAAERVLLPAATPQPAWSTGTWSQGPDAATRTAGPSRGGAFLVPNVPGGAVEHGLVRLEVEVSSGAPDFTLLLRFTPGRAPHPQAFDGYGLSVESGKLVLHRWARGQPYRAGPSVPLKKMKAHRRVELVAFLAGPHLGAFLYDARTLELLGALAHHDAALPAGHAGVRVDNARAAATRFLRLSVSRGAPPLPGPAGDPGADRLVRVPEAQLASVPASLREGLLAPLPGEEGPGVPLRLQAPAELERLRRAGVTPVAVSARVAWKDVDPRYREALARAPGQVPPPGTYKDWEMVEAVMRQAEAAHPDVVQRVPLGRTHQGRTVWAARVTAHPRGPVDRPAVLLNGGHHADELLGTEFVLDALERVLARAATPEGQGLLSALDLWFVPLVNPDGNAAFTRLSRHAGRKNGRDLDGDGRFEPDEGVDLNRNYPFQWGALGEDGSRSLPWSDLYRGASEGSEPETQALVALARAQHFVASLSFHTSATAVLVPYTVSSVQPPRPHVAREVAEALVDGSPAQVSGRPFRVLPRLYPVDGTDQDWHAWAHGTVALLVEGAAHNPLEPERAARAVEGTRLLVERLLARVANGPRLELHVKGPGGEPLPATVRLRELQTFAGERWTARARDGRFDLLVSGSGPFHAELGHEGFAPVTAELWPGRPAEVTLRPDPPRSP